MDNLTLSLLVLIFFMGLFIYFATQGHPPPPPPKPPARKVPAVLRCNVAVARLMEQL